MNLKHKTNIPVRKTYELDIGNRAVHLVMPWPLGPLIHHIMEHPAHHLDATIPLYQLKRAQQHLKHIGAGFTSTRFTLSYYRRCVNVCQLYDYQQQRWVPFPH